MKIFWFITFHTKNLIAAKPFCIRFDKIDDGNRHLVLFGSKKI